MTAPTTTAPRQVPGPTLWRVASTTLGHMACAYGDPKRDGHDHDVCLRDDEAYAADVLLGLIAQVTRKDETAALDALADLLAAVKDT